MAAKMNVKCYVVNLPSAIMRRKFRERQFRRLRIDNYSFVEGIDAAKVTDEWIDKQIDKKNLIRPLTKGEVCCCLAHREALKRLIDDNDTDVAIIMEDDIVIYKEFEQVIQDVLPFINKGSIVMFNSSVHDKESFYDIDSF